MEDTSGMHGNSSKEQVLLLIQTTLTLLEPQDKLELATPSLERNCTNANRELQKDTPLPALSKKLLLPADQLKLDSMFTQIS